MEKTPKIGAFVLETLTTGMYTHPLDSIREFVQNAADSIRAAEDQGVLDKGAGRIVVTLDPKARRLTIRDNGTGVPRDEAYERLVNIGMSGKRIGIDAGFRGIGRLAAVAYCQILRFRTSARGETTCTTISFDCDALRKACAPSMRQVEELSGIMGRHSELATEKHAGDIHFFEVEMEGIAESADDFLEPAKLEDYLGQVAPVEYDAHRFVYASTIGSWARAHGLSVPTVSLLLDVSGNQREVFKPFKTRYKTHKSNGGGLTLDIKGVHFFPENPGADTPFWLWYGASDWLGAIDEPRSAGLRLRKHNIALGGPERVAEVFARNAESDGRFNSYFVGEIHVCSPGAVPNARRDGFEDTDAWEQIRASLLPFFAQRVKDIRDKSKDRNRPVQKVARTADAAIVDATGRLKTGFASKPQRESCLEKLEREIERVSDAQEAPRTAGEQDTLKAVRQRLEATRDAVRDEGGYCCERLKSSLDRKQRKVIQEILEILHEALDAENFKKAEAAILGKFQANGEN